ncbi:MAG: methyltransferase domain-containing protein [Patescibacteria group bacterium]
MHPRFLEIFCSPTTGKPLQLTQATYDDQGCIESGQLITQDGQETYPIVRGIPRFVEKEQYASSFGYEWARWPRLQFEDQNRGTAMHGYTQNMFDQVTHFTADSVRGKMVVEFGCGSGRFLDRVRALGGCAVGLEMSTAADVAAENFSQDQEHVCVVQGDVLHPPFRPEVFDDGFTIGVLHHTPNPEEGLRQLARTVKPGGNVICRVYSRHGFYAYPSVRIARAMHRLLANIVGKKPADRCFTAYAAFSAHVLYPLLQAVRAIPLAGKYVAAGLERYVVVNVNLPDARWRMLDVFDAMTPYYASTHTTEEIRSWFQHAGITSLQQIKENTFIGIKP